MSAALLRPAGTEVALADLLAVRLIATDLQRLSARRRTGPAPGQRRSRQRGQGREFAELKAYQPGEDVRRIDWRVTARRRSPYLRVMEEDRHQPQLIWLDLSASLFFGSERLFKSVLACHWAAFLAWRLAAGRHPVSLLVTGAGPDRRLTLRRPAEAALACRELVAAHQTLALHYRDGTEAPGPERLAPLLRHRPGVWLLSDLSHWDGATLARALPAERLDHLVMLQPLDNAEADLPEAGSLTVVAGTERGRLDTDGPARRRHRQAFEARQQGWADWARRHGADWRPSRSQTFDWSEVHAWPLPT